MIAEPVVKKETDANPLDNLDIEGALVDPFADQDDSERRNGIVFDNVSTIHGGESEESDDDYALSATAPLDKDEADDIGLPTKIANQTEDEQVSSKSTNVKTTEVAPPTAKSSKKTVGNKLAFSSSPIKSASEEEAPLPAAPTSSKKRKAAGSTDGHPKTPVSTEEEKAAKKSKTEKKAVPVAVIESVETTAPAFEVVKPIKSKSKRVEKTADHLDANTELELVKPVAKKSKKSKK